MDRVFFNNFFLLLLIFEHSKKTGSMVSSTSRIAVSLNISQQSVSRKINELVDAGFVVKKSSVGGSELFLTSKAIDLLKSVFFKLNNCFSKSNSKIFGRVVSGFGEGAYYICQRKYLGEFQKKLGFSPFCGTLNIEVNSSELNAVLLGLNPIKINGFKLKNRSFGFINCFRVLINGEIKGAVVFPERTSHGENVVELIAPYNLRKKLKLKNNSKIFFELII